MIALQESPVFFGNDHKIKATYYNNIMMSPSQKEINNLRSLPRTTVGKVYGFWYCNLRVVSPQDHNRQGVYYS